MTALWALIPGPIKSALLWALFGTIVSTSSFYYGRQRGIEQAVVSALETSVKVLRKRNEIDETVSTSDAAALCAEYGLSDNDQAECVRRVREVDTQP